MNLKNIFKKKPISAPVEETTLAGHLFTVLDPVKMSNVRKAKFFLESYERDLGMTKDDLMKFDDFILSQTKFPTDIGSLNELNADLVERMKKIYAVIQQRQAVIAQDYQYKPFLKAATIIILIDDEKENEITSKYQSLKMQLCKEHDEVEAFFLRVIMTFQLSIINSSTTSKTSNLLSLKEQKTIETSLFNTINTTIYDN